MKALFSTILLLVLVNSSIAAEMSSQPLAPLAPIFQKLCTTSPEIVQLRSSATASAERWRVKSLYFVPTLTLDGAAGFKDPVPGDNGGLFGSGTSGRLGVTAALNLNPLLGPHYEERSEKLRRELTQLELLVGAQGKVIEVLEAVLNLNALRAEDANAKETFARVERQYRLLKENVRLGIGRRRDEIRFETELLRQEELRLRIQRASEEAANRLKVLVGDVGAGVPDLPWSKLLELDITGVAGVVTSPALEQAQLSADIAEISTRVARAKTGLTTNFIASYQSTNTSLAPTWSEDSLRRSWGTGWFVGLGFKLPLWDNGADALARADAGRERDVAESRRHQAERQFATEKTTLENERQRLLKRRQWAERLYGLEQKSFQQTALDYREGRVGYLDWLNASQNLQGALKSLIDLASEWAKLHVRTKQFRGELANGLCD